MVSNMLSFSSVKSLLFHIHVGPHFLFFVSHFSFIHSPRFIVQEMIETVAEKLRFSLVQEMMPKKI